MSTAPRVELGRLLEFRHDDGSVVFSGSHGGMRYRLEPAALPAMNGRPVWSLVVEATPRPPVDHAPALRKARGQSNVGAASARSGARRSAPARKRHQPTDAERREKRAEVRRSEEVLRGLGVDPSSEIREDEVLL